MKDTDNKAYIASLTLRLTEKGIEVNPDYLYSYYNINREIAEETLVYLKDKGYIKKVWPNLPNYY